VFSDELADMATFDKSDTKYSDENKMKEPAKLLRK
jgi:hypothetical protein